jgi:hypothetical protein
MSTAAIAVIGVIVIILLYVYMYSKERMSLAEIDRVASAIRQSRERLASNPVSVANVYGRERLDMNIPWTPYF